MHLAYITTGYPYVSHTFIQNEVVGLRKRGIRIDTYAVVQAPRSECRTQADREAYETTVALRPVRLGRYVRAHINALRGRPRGYWRALRRAVALAGTAPRDLVRHAAYFVQAIVLAEEVAASGAEHIHAHFANVSSDLAMLAAAASEGRIGWSFTLHGSREFSDVNHFRLPEKAADAEFVVCISNFTRSQLMSHTPMELWPKFHIARCGVDTTRFSPPAQRHCSPNRFRIACVGRLSREKAQAILIQAASRLVARGRQIEVVLIGDGPTREALQELVDGSGLTETVHFLGARSPAEVVELLRDSDAFCLPSFQEGVPIVLMEAMAMEVACVASRITGIPELIESGHSGLLVRPGSSEELADQLETLIVSEDLRRTLGTHARQAVVASYSLDPTIDAKARRFELELTSSVNQE